MSGEHEETPAPMPKQCAGSNGSGGFQFHRRLDIVAVVALILALGNAGFSVFVYFSSYKIEPVRQELVMFYYDTVAEDFRTAAIMTYNNVSRYHRSDPIVREFVDVTFPSGNCTRLTWEVFSFTTSYSKEATSLKNALPVKPFVIPPDSIEAHETTFSPVHVTEKPCEMYDQRVTLDRDSAYWDGSGDIVFEFSYVLSTDETYSFPKCRVEASQIQIRRLLDKKSLTLSCQ